MTADVVSNGLSRYQLLASAVAGCNVRVALGKEGERSYTDGRTIFVSPGASRPADLDHLTVQGALLAAGSLDAAIMRRLLGRPSLARRYLAIEGTRALGLIADVLPGVPVAATAKNLSVASRSPEESLTAAMRLKAVPDPPEVFGIIRPRRFLSTPPPDNGSGAAPELDPSPPVAVEESGEDEETEELAKLTRKFLELLLSSPRYTFLQRFWKTQGGRREASEGGGELRIGAVGSTRRSGSPATVCLIPAPALQNDTLSDWGSEFRYPEWDVWAGRYRHRWCTVMEVDPREEDFRSVERPQTRHLRRHLARLGVGLERCRRQPQGDDIDLDAAVEARVEVLAGASPDEGLYVESQRRKRSLAVLVLLDVSGSSAEGAAVPGTVHEQQRAAAAALTDALDGLGDRVALYGFRSEGRSAVYLLHLKAFDDALNGLVFTRLGAVVPGGYTRFGAAIRHGAHVLETKGGTERRLLVVLSDGFPYDDEYDGDYGEADARRALSEARRRGIGCLCLTLGASTEPDALRRVFGTAFHANAPCLEALMPEMGRLFRRALASADLQRRLAQRRQPADRIGAT